MGSLIIPDDAADRARQSGDYKTRCDLYLLRLLAESTPDGRLPDDADWIGQRVAQQVVSGLRALVSGGYLNKCDEDCAAAADIPEPLRKSPEFLAAWARWEKHLREKRARLTPSARAYQLNRCLKWGPLGAVKVIEHCIGNNWRGLFPPKGFDPGRRPGESADAADERQRREVRASQEKLNEHLRHKEAIAKRVAYVKALDAGTVKRLHAAVVAMQPNDVARAACAKADPCGGGRLTDLIYQQHVAEQLAKEGEGK